MKNLSFLIMILFGAMALKAQETFFPTKEGMVLTYNTFDKKGKLTSAVKYTIEHVSVNGSNMDITYLCESLDNKDKLVFKEEITIHQKGDILYLDMGNFINKAAFQQDGEIPANIAVKGNNMQIPLNPQPGQTLPDASVEMAMKMGFINMKIGANVTNRKVEDIEDVSVPAGNFRCYKFSSDINSVAMGVKAEGKSIEWYAKGVGTVETESYDKKGNLISKTELVGMTQ